MKKHIETFDNRSRTWTVTPLENPVPGSELKLVDLKKKKKKHRRPEQTY